MLAKRLGAKRIVAETGAGQHGVASAAACARLGLPCTVYMGAVDMERQAPNVGRMRLLGREVVPVTSGDRTLRAAIDEALRDWVADPLDTYYLIGSAVGPHPYPYLVRELQAVIGREARAQMLEEGGRCRMRSSPASAAAPTPSAPSMPSCRIRAVAIIGIEAGGRGQGLGDNAATLSFGSPGVLHGSFSMLLQDEDGQIQETHSVSAGLDYPGVGPEHCAAARRRPRALSDCIGRRGARGAEGVQRVRRHPAGDRKRARARSARGAGPPRIQGRDILVCLSGRGDKDMPTLQRPRLPRRRRQ